ncbi:hypothetical protein Psi02_21170 [Planotetraspora silvatica]|uniref:Right handed beta helix domain-containing protein n=1 Tax=Planotetraspora silvatica TaxID=234614 RepID=A0A8J3XR29_9ACTN|nr:right-handed parallel beta-helix repeat-containing protein [Planotetraspora silvatica]GII45693.1 hypothetical protein Psi02_21170 [Planotetraspora silvatica]
MMRLAVVVSSIAVLLLTACTPGSADPKPTPSASPTPPVTVKYGVPPNIALKPSESLKAKSGQVIENLDITGQVFIGDGVHDVVIRNCRFNGDGSQWYAIQTAGDGSATVDHVTIRGDYKDAGISYHNVTVTHADIYGMTHDGIKVGNNVTVADSRIRDFAPVAGAHSDGLQIFERVSGVTIKNNLVNPGLGGGSRNGKGDDDTAVNSALIFADSVDRGTAGRIVVDGNVLGGGGYTVYFDVPGDTHFTDNKFLRDSYLYGPVDGRADTKEWRGNTFADNGEPISLPKGQ